MIAPAKPQLERLLGVTLEVSADIGAVSMTIAQVLELGPGSVVEFRRPVDQPVDLRVNDRVVARGEIVAVDDRYALRITELVPAT